MAAACDVCMYITRHWKGHFGSLQSQRSEKYRPLHIAFLRFPTFAIASSVSFQKIDGSLPASTTSLAQDPPRAQLTSYLSPPDPSSSKASSKPGTMTLYYSLVSIYHFSVFTESLATRDCCPYHHIATLLCGFSPQHCSNSLLGADKWFF
jgi:hypothetical protein